jgi:hypothetical protein
MLDHIFINVGKERFLFIGTKLGMCTFSNIEERNGKEFLFMGI